MSRQLLRFQPSLMPAPTPEDADQPRPEIPPPAGERPGSSPEQAGSEAGGATETPTRLIRTGVGLGTELIARQPTPAPGEAVAVLKVCPHCGTEYETDARFCPKDGAALRPLGGPDSLVGSTLAERYHILKLVGEGGMGRVYLAEHVRMNRQCAVKVMRSSLLHDTDAAARFGREASSAANILHPNVAAVFDFGEADGMVYLVMEYVDGEPLSAILERDGKLEPLRAAELARQVADGLAAAHELGIVHRDLKPDNILVAQSKSGREVAKVVDFGIAKAAAEGQTVALTRTGLVIGTPEFMSPEQLLGDPVDARSDIYGLGCILYLMLVGRPAADAPTRDAMLKRRLREAPPHPRALVPEVPPELDAIVVKMLATAPADRFPNAAAVRDALAALVEGPPRAASVTGEAVTEEMEGTPRSVPTLKMEAIPEPQGRRVDRRKLALGGGAAALVVAVALLARGLSSGHSAAGARPDSASISRPPVTAIVPPVPAAKSVAERTRKTDSGAAAKTAAERARRQTSSTSSPTRAAPAAERTGAATSAADRATSGPRSALERFRAAFQSESMDRIRDVYPNPTSDQAKGWTGLFQQADDFKASLDVGSLNVNGATATAGFEMRVQFRYPSHELAGTTLHYQAVLERKDDRWVIRSLR